MCANHPHDWTWYVTLVGRNLRTLTFIQQSTRKQISAIHDTRYETKDEMKAVGGMANEVSTKLVEYHILGMAKTVEDLLWALKEDDGQPRNFWTDLNQYPHFTNAAMVRHLSNAIKHNGGYILEGDGDTSRRLMEDYGFQDGTPIGNWGTGSADGPEYAPLKLLYGIQQFCFAIISDLCQVQLPSDDWNDDEIDQKMIAKWLGDFPGMT